MPTILTILAALLLGLAAGGTAGAAEPRSCPPTPPDMEGPFYRPGAPLRAKVGEGFQLSGTVRSARDCGAIAGARIEYWLAGPEGRYADAYRGSLLSGSAGEYRLESHPPPPYGGRPAHIHLRISAAGFQPLVTQYYPPIVLQRAVFDLVLLPR